MTAEIKAEYIDHMGDDLRVVNAARVSFDKESEWERGECLNPLAQETFEYAKKLSERDAKLLRYLAKHDHFTPFTHCVVTLRETVPIFVARQRFKHQIGFTYNEVSRRYVDDEPEFYMPKEWRKKADNKKQGSSDDIVDSNELVKYAIGALNDACLNAYNSLLEAGVCPEQARMVLPQSMMTSYYVTGSLAAFARAYNLRIQPDAQREIQDLAEQWDSIIRPLFPHSWAALTENE